MTRPRPRTYRARVAGSRPHVPDRRWWRRWDVLLPLVLTVTAQVEFRSRYSTEWAAPTVPHAALLVLTTLPLVFQRRFALLVCPAAVAVWAAEPLFFPVSNTFSVPLAVFGLAPLAVTRWARTPFLGWVGASTTVVLLGLQGFLEDRFGTGAVVANVVFGAAVAAIGGIWARVSRQRVAAEATAFAERRAREEADGALAAERSRIARELHDALGHGLSVVLLQLRGARRMLDREPEVARTALDEAERAASAALLEVRLLMDVLRYPSGEPVPQPGLSSIPGLVDGVRRTGASVELRMGSRPPEIPAALEVSCYRVVQEGLTNALRHAPGSDVEVEILFPPGAVVLTVRNDAGGVPSGGGSRRGLTGLRERAALFGGSVQAGPQPGGGFGLVVVLPVPGVQSSIPGREEMA